VAGLLSLGLYFKCVVLMSISHFSRTVGPHWTCHWSCLARRVRVLLWGRECVVLVRQMPGTSWTESLYAHSSLYTCTCWCACFEGYEGPFISCLGWGGCLAGLVGAAPGWLWRLGEGGHRGWGLWFGILGRAGDGAFFCPHSGG
jgi:hypothetical protein